MGPQRSHCDSSDSSGAFCSLWPQTLGVDVALPLAQTSPDGEGLAVPGGADTLRGQCRPSGGESGQLDLWSLVAPSPSSAPGSRLLTQAAPPSDEASLSRGERPSPPRSYFPGAGR